MTTQHTQGRLKTGTGPHGVLSILEEIDECPVGGAFSLDDARRLVACWNACEGISTEALERLGTLDRARVELDVLRTQVVVQRNELLEALKRIEGATMSMYATRSDMLEHCQDIARAAIAKAEGGAA